jgi:hypothetical protein
MEELGTGMAQGAYFYTNDTRTSNVSQTQELRQTSTECDGRHSSPDCAVIQRLHIFDGWREGVLFGKSDWEGNGKGNDNSRSPSGMTTRKAKTKAGKAKVREAQC